LTSSNRLGTPDEIAETICWRLSPRVSYVHGMTLVADGAIVMY
jgi:NAD(P)-dependent dehydrogenase (short-subunit alcohol dehydrogenase family)